MKVKALSFLVCATLLTGLSAKADLLNREIVKMSNIINNSIPAQYRDQLNAALTRVALAANNASCVNVQPARPSMLCTVEKDKTFNYFQIVRNGETVSSATYNIADEVAEFQKLRDAGLCDNSSVAEECSIEKDKTFNYYTVTRRGESISSASYNIIDTAQTRNDLIQKGICF